MAKKKKSHVTPVPSPKSIRRWKFSPRIETLLAAIAYLAITALLTFPLIFRMNNSVYGPYDHATTDLFAAIYQNFWWIGQAVFSLHISPMHNPFLAAPFGTDMSFVNFTGFAELPVTGLFGAVFARNLNIIANLVLAGLGMFLLVRHITGNAGAGFVAGLVFAFCPNMMARSYTTFDSTQVQWIPFYTLYILKFIKIPSWKNALLSGLFLICHILFSFPYYLVYLPVQTLVMVAALAIWRMRTEKLGISEFIQSITSRTALKAWLKLGVALLIAIMVFGIYYTTIIGGSDRILTAGRTVEQLEELALVPTDYLVPHPRMNLFGDSAKAAYWDKLRPGKNSDSFVAYIGYIALVLMVFGIRRGKGAEKWIFIAGAAVAFWSTLGPTLFGLPTPSGLIHSLYANFARRILIYKVFVQFGIAGLAGMGFAHIIKNIKKPEMAPRVLVILSVAIIAEYMFVPPALNVNLTNTPEIYHHVAELPEGSKIIEVPLKRNNGYWYQGYVYYQSFHKKPLFNPQFGLNGVPEHIQPFYEQMTIPIEATDYANLAALRYLGITHLIYHWHIGTLTVRFLSHAAPALYIKEVSGLKPIYQSIRDPLRVPFDGPTDYIFADLYEITAEPCPVAVTYDYPSPYEPSADAGINDGLINIGNSSTVGWYSALFDTTRSFYYPLPNSDKLDRLMHQDGTVTLTNLSDDPVDFNLTLSVMADSTGRKIEALWNNRESIGNFTIGPQEERITLESIRLDGGGQGTVIFRTDRGAYQYPIGEIYLPANAVIRDIRVRMKE